MADPIVLSFKSTAKMMKMSRLSAVMASAAEKMAKLPIMKKLCRKLLSWG
jgi:hypothetical protein